LSSHLRLPVDVIGLLTGVDELASIESNEVVDFRKHMHEMCERTARARDSQVVKAAAAAAAYSIKDVFDNVEAQKNIDFIKETCFCKQL